MVNDIEDPRRTEPPKDGLGEREMLEGWLEFHRTTLLLKTEGMDDETRKARPVATSKLSLHGLVRHMAEVERSWFTRVLQSDPTPLTSGTTPVSRTATWHPSTTPTGRMIWQRGRRSVNRAV